VKKILISALIVFLLALMPLSALANETGTFPVNPSFTLPTYPNSFSEYLKNKWNPEIGGFRCYDLEGANHPDYYNYWVDDHARVAIAFDLLGEYDEAQKAIDFLHSMRMGNGYYPNRKVDSEINYTGTLGKHDYYITNRIVGIGNASSYGQPFPPGLVARYSFSNQSDFDIVWDEWNNLNGTRHGWIESEPGDPPGWDWSASGFGRILRFDGIDDYVEVPNRSPYPRDAPHFHMMLDIARQFSLFARINLEGDSGTIVQKGENYHLYFEAGNITFSFSGSSGTHRVSASYPDGWFTVAVTYNMSKLVLYIDGSVADWQSTTDLMNIASDYPLVMGAKRLPDGSYENFGKFEIDDLFIFRRALLSEEVQALHERNRMTFGAFYRKEMVIEGSVYREEPFYFPALFLYDLTVNGTRIFDRLQADKFDETWYQILEDDKIILARLMSISPDLDIWFNATIIEGKPYALISISAVNKGTNILDVENLSLGLGAIREFTFPVYDPVYLEFRLSNGTCFEKFVNGYSDVDYQQWSHSVNGGYLKYLGICGNNTKPDSFNPGIVVICLNETLIQEVDYSTAYEHSIRIQIEGETLSPSSQSSKRCFMIVPFRRYERQKWQSIFNTVISQIEAGVIENIDVGMPPAYGLIPYAYALHWKLTNNSKARELAIESWNFYYSDLSNRMIQSKIYFKSMIAIALAGLMLDPNNSTYRNFAIQTVNFLLQAQDMDPTSVTYGRLMYPICGLDEHGWYSMLLGRMYELTGNHTYYDRRRILHNALKADGNYFTLETYVLNQNGERDRENGYAKDRNTIFRAGELLYGCLYGGESLGSAKWNDPFMLSSASLIFKFSELTDNGTAIGCANTETQPACIIGYLAWINASETSDKLKISFIEPYMSLKKVFVGEFELCITANIPPGYQSIIRIDFVDETEPEHIKINNAVVEEASSIADVWFSDHNLWTINNSTIYLKVFGKGDINIQIEWLREPWPLTKIKFFLGILGFILVFLSPTYTIKKMKEKEYLDGMVIGFILFIIGVALIIGWLWE